MIYSVPTIERVRGCEGHCGWLMGWAYQSGWWGLQKCVVEAGPRRVVFQSLEATRVSIVWIILRGVHESADDDTQFPSSFITRSD